MYLVEGLQSRIPLNKVLPFADGGNRTSIFFQGCDLKCSLRQGPAIGALHIGWYARSVSGIPQVPLHTIGNVFCFVLTPTTSNASQPVHIRLSDVHW